MTAGPWLRDCKVDLRAVEPIPGEPELEVPLVSLVAEIQGQVLIVEGTEADIFRLFGGMTNELVGYVSRRIGTHLNLFDVESSAVGIESMRPSHPDTRPLNPPEGD